MEGTIIRKSGIWVLFILVLSGCVGNASGIHVYNNTSEKAEKAEDIFANDDRLRSVFVVFNEKDLLTGTTVGTFSRFHKEKIEKELKKKLQAEYPDAKILVSADNKIVMEIKKLTETTDEKEIGKKIKHIKSHSKEET